jgi:hypothetical protein
MMIDNKNMTEWKYDDHVLPVLTRLVRHMFNSESIEQ